MDIKIPGLHHVTAIASDPQRNLDFYAGVLGLRFVSGQARDVGFAARAKSMPSRSQFQKTRPATGWSA